MNDRQAVFEEFNQQKKKLLRNGQDINFEDVKEGIENLIWFFKTYYSNEEYFRPFTQNERSEIDNQIFPAVQMVFRRILDKTDWSTVNDASFRQVSDWKNQIRDFDSAFSSIYYSKLLSAVGARLKTDSLSDDFQKRQDSIIRSLEERTKIFLDEQQKFVGEMTESRLTARRTIESLQKSQQKAEKSLAKQIESSYGSEFLKRVAEYKKAANKWLTAQIIFGISFVGAASALILWSVLHPEMIKQNPLISALKFGSLFIGVYVLQILNRNYAANKHLQVLNLHRASILAITNDMVNAVDSDLNKEFLLTYAARIIFDYGETGYITRNYGAGSSNDDGFGLEKFLTPFKK